LIGPTGSGKSTFAAANFKSVEIISTDYLRGLLSSDPADQSASGEAFRILNLVVSGRMKRRLTTVIDATSLRAASRKRYRDIAARAGVPVIAIAFDLPASVYHARNLGRPGRVVLSEVVDKQIDVMSRTILALPGEGYAALYVLREGDEFSVALARTT
jgi:protein phosphatase